MHNASASDNKTRTSYYDKLIDPYLDFITSRLACLFFGFFLGAFLVSAVVKAISESLS